MTGLIHSVLDGLMGLGYWGIMLGLAIEIIPSEIVLAYAGYLVSQGAVNTWEAVLFGTIGIIIAQMILYWIGLYGGRPFLDRYGKYLLMKPKAIDKAEAWFNRFGAGIVFTARFLPVLRQAISIPAGMARMSVAKFLFYTVLATVPWCILFIQIGKSLGENWQEIDRKAGPLMHGLLYGALALAVVYFVWSYMRGRKPAASGRGGDYGYVGEKNVAHQLKFIGSEYKVFNRRRVQGRHGSQEFDHIVVGPNGLFHIETKNWGGEIRFTEHGVERSKEGHHEDPTAQLYRHENVLKELLRGHKLQADVVGILCFANSESRIIGQSPAFRTVKLDRLVHEIRTYKPKHSVSTADVKVLAGLIEQNSGPS